MTLHVRSILRSTRWTLTVLVSALFLTSAPAAALQGLVQLRLTGEVAAPSSEGQGSGDFGHLVEVEIDSSAGTEPQSVVLHLHLANGTTGGELLQLVSAKLKLAGIPATFTPTQGTGKESPWARGASLWVEGATRVHLRLGAGLVGSLSCVEGPPQGIRLHPASAIPGSTLVFVSGSTAIVMKDRAPIRGRVTFSTALEKVEHAAEAATALWKAATGKWVSDRPGGDTWRPLKMSNGAALTGVSIRLGGQSDWALEIAL